MAVRCVAQDAMGWERGLVFVRSASVIVVVFCKAYFEGPCRVPAIEVSHHLTLEPNNHGI